MRIARHPGALVTINPLSACSLGGYLTGVDAAASAVWTASNRAHLMPFRLSRPFVVTQMAFMNGATASGNIDVGIYDASGTRIISAGGVAQNGAILSAQQTFDVTDVVVGPGLFYVAGVMDNTTGTVFRLATNVSLVGLAAQVESAYPLPATVAFAADANAFVPLVSITGRSVL